MDRGNLEIGRNRGRPRAGRRRRRCSGRLASRIVLLVAVNRIGLLGVVVGSRVVLLVVVAGRSAGPAFRRWWWAAESARPAKQAGRE